MYIEHLFYIVPVGYKIGASETSLAPIGGGGWIRTTEAKRNRFTVCPLWPLGNSSKYKIVELVDGFEPPTC